LEALSCGVPIRGFKSGSAAEFLPQNGAVELVEDQNLDQLETQVVDYLKAKSTHLKTRQLARDWTLNNFNIEKNIAEIENFFFPAQPGLIFTKATRSIGGGEIQTINLAQELIQQHQRVAVITNTDSPIKAIASKMSVESLDLGPEATSRYSILYFLLFSWHNQAPAKKLLRNLYSQGFRILVCQSINEKIILSPIAQRLGFRVIWLDFQLLLPWLPRNPLFSRLKNASKYVDRILTTSHYLQTQHEKLGLGKVTVIPPGISLPTKGTRKAYDAQNVVIGLVGRLHSEKGFDVFLKALKGLPETVRAIIVGDGPQRTELEDLTAKLGLKNRVEFRGFIQDTGSIYQQFDIFCQPSRRDNTPLTVLEAMAQGLPIVASRVGAIGEIVGEAGVMIVPDNVQALTQALTKLINNPNQLQIMSQKSLKQAQKFSISNMAQDFYAQASTGHSLS
jgi:glycosyltransferase involved in cell wall biosynthesis